MKLKILCHKCGNRAIIIADVEIQYKENIRNYYLQ